jgi:UDP-glucose 4-epimerase
MRLLITGGAGFIGSNLADVLLKQGHFVCIVDNYLTGKVQNNQIHKNLSILNDSITTYTSLANIFKEFRPQIVIHAAASFSNPNDWENDIKVNILGTVNVIKASKAFGIEKLIYYQTSLCYGIATSNETIEVGYPYFSGTYSGGSSYAISKTAAELYLELSGLNFISFRLANVYGPRNLSGPLPTFFYRLTNQLPCTIGNTKRDFIYIDDVINCTCKAINSNIQKGYYQISTGLDFYIIDLFEKTLEILGLQKGDVNYECIERGIDDVQTILLNPTKTMQDFNWKPEVSFYDGIQLSLNWYKHNPIDKTYTHLKDFSS